MLQNNSKKTAQKSTLLSDNNTFLSQVSFLAKGGGKKEISINLTYWFSNKISTKATTNKILY